MRKLTQKQQLALWLVTEAQKNGELEDHCRWGRRWPNGPTIPVWFGVYSVEVGGLGGRHPLADVKGSDYYVLRVDDRPVRPMNVFTEGELVEIALSMCKHTPLEIVEAIKVFLLPFTSQERSEMLAAAPPVLTAHLL